MKTLSKKIIIYVICGLMTFSVVSTSYYKSVHAMEWVGGALAFEEALKWLMAAIGITATAGMTDAYWTQYGDDFEDYCTEQNITNQEVTEWQMKLCQGILDKGSECWSAFKSWSQGLISGNTGGGSGAVGSVSLNAEVILSGFSNAYGYSGNSVTYKNDAQKNLNFKFAFGNSSGSSVYLYTDMPVSFELANSSNNTYLLSFNSGSLIEATYNTILGGWVLANTSDFANKYVSDGVYIWTNGFDFSGIQYNSLNLSDSSGGGSGSLSNNNIIINRFIDASGLSFQNVTYNSNIDDLNIVNICGFNQSNRYLYLYLFVEGSNFYFNNSTLYGNNLSWYNITFDTRASSNNMSLSQLWGSYNSTSFSNGIYYYLSNLVNPITTSENYTVIDIGVDSGGVADENFQSVTNNVEDLDVISDTGVDETNPEVSIPMPGLSDSDNTASNDAYDDIVDAINDGTITIDEGIERIQEIIRVITYDTVTDDVIPVKPDPNTGENKKKDDVIKENKENASFGLNGLQNIFPFCIPFDIYAFMNLLVADPVAPEFDFPIKSVNGRTEQIHVDLEPFEPVAVVVRYVFDFLFIVGLGLMTRSMIGGGSSD